MAVACIGALLAVYQTVVPRLWSMISAAGLYAGVSIAGFLYGVTLQRFLVAQNEQLREIPYMAYSIAATRISNAASWPTRPPRAPKAPARPSHTPP